MLGFCAREPLKSSRCDTTVVIPNSMNTYSNLIATSTTNMQGSCGS
jgi:hypothetical protein